MALALLLWDNFIVVFWWSWLIAGDDYGPAPDLDHLNVELRAALKEWMNWLKNDIGFCGWRLDFARGYGAQFAAGACDAGCRIMSAALLM